MSKWQHPYRSRYSITLLLFVVSISCNDNTCPGLDATLWHQHAEEYKTLCRNLYAHASLRLREAKNTPTWSADIYQMNADTLPEETALIMDIDETVLNNAPLFARVLKSKETDMGKAWANWAKEAVADPIPGAAPFVRGALSSGIHVFFVSNRSCSIDNHTIANLRNAKFPVNHPNVYLLSRNTNYHDIGKIDSCPALKRTVAKVFHRKAPLFYPYKGERRALVASKFRVLMLIGDSQGDFFSPPPLPDDPPKERTRLLRAQLTPKEREEINQKYGKYFQDRWMQLPNVMYGNWLSSRTGYRSLSMDEIVRRRLSLLNLN
jgi:acid phosphatase